MDELSLDGRSPTIILFRRENDDDTLAYEDAIIRALQGGKGAGGYLATGEDLGISLRVFSSTPPMSPAEALSGFSHTLIALIVDDQFANSTPDLWTWINECLEILSSTSDSMLLPYAIDERSKSVACNASKALANLQFDIVTNLGERAIRPAMLALRIIHECRLLLSGAFPDLDRHYAKTLPIFISHAKLDGIPLAHSLMHQVESIWWLKSFYDVKDLPVGSAWKEQLEEGVRSSIVVMLRTEHYDSRPWCRQEVLWADEYGSPAVLVDARTDLSHDPSLLPYDRIPVVRIPDGNLLRILFLALREGLRYALFRARVQIMIQSGVMPKCERLTIFSIQPSMLALLNACRDAAGEGATIFLYPDPPLSTGLYEAAAALVKNYAPNASLLTPNTLFATTPTA